MRRTFPAATRGKRVLDLFYSVVTLVQGPANPGVRRGDIYYY